MHCYRLMATDCGELLWKKIFETKTKTISTMPCGLAHDLVLP